MNSNNQLEKIFEQSKFFFYNSQFENVIDLLEKLIEEIHDPNILLIYYKSLIITQKNNQSVNYLIKALEYDPKNLDILYEILAYYHNNDEDTFNIYFDKLLQIKDDININLLMIKNKNFQNEKFKMEYNLKKEFSNSFSEKTKITYRYLILKNLNILDTYLLYEDKIEFWESFFLSKKLQEEEIKYLIHFTMYKFDEISFQENLLIQKYIENIKGKKDFLFNLSKIELLTDLSYENLTENYKDLLDSAISSNDLIIAIIKYLSTYSYDNEEYNDQYKKYIHIFYQQLNKNDKYNVFLNKNNKKIRIGYISPDFRLHSMRYFLMQLYENFDSETFEIYSYYINDKYDIYTENYKRRSNWKDVFNLTDKEIADIIYNDRIDILVDLTGFTYRSRTNIFSYKPSPIQISMIGYHDTLALDTIDYKILDEHLSKNIESYFIEKIINIPDSFFCYQADEDLPDINNLPYLKNGYLTFGSFNYGTKINEKTIYLWSKILNKYKNSKIIIKCKQTKYSFFKEKVLNYFRKYNVSENRIIFKSFLENSYNHLQIYNDIDISLDTYPYNGVTTTFESLIMGVPVLTFSGNTCSSRAGKSILSNLNLKNWIISNLEEEINLDLNNLEYLRENLRKKLLSSVLCDHKGFTSKLENIYKQILKR